MKFTVKQKKIITNIKDYTYILLGCILTALAIDIFLVPFKIAPGGLTGIATVVFHLTDGRFSIGLVILVINIPLFLIGIKHIGGNFFVKTIISTLLLSFFIDLFEPHTNRFVEKYLLDISNINSTANLMLYCIFGGAITGIGLGIVFRAGATTGGTDLAARILHKFLPKFSVGQILLFVDGVVVVFAAIAFQSVLLGLYAIVTIYITSKVIDAVLEGINYAKAVYIISDYSDEIAKRILNEVNRGVTGLDGTGMYTHSEKKVLMSVLERSQIPKVKKLVKEIDPNAFIVVSDVREVFGEGFSS